MVTVLLPYTHTCSAPCVLCPSLVYTPLWSFLVNRAQQSMLSPCTQRNRHYQNFLAKCIGEMHWLFRSGQLSTISTY